MTRPKKTRWVKCKPKARCFKPLCKCKKGEITENVELTVDEFEALRLYDLEGLEQEEIARRMKVHRSTVSRIIDLAHNKVADAFVNIKGINIGGGCYKFDRSAKKRK